MKKELLVPAGNKECLIAAVFNGADAVYLALKKFGARKYANNFSNEDVIDAIKFCHLYGVKVYVTMNTLVKNAEVNAFLDQVRFLYKNGVDAILMQDFGMICLVREMFPNLEIHASTQANNSSYETVKLFYDLGIKRVVFSRELSLEEIESIDIPIEKEVFIHGALCVSYSGCCLMSSMLGGRSGNRGECAGSCRLKYDLLDGNKTIINDKYLLSTKELNTARYIDRLLNSSIYSLKIEGRMKGPLYVGFITNFYRRLIDGKDINLEDEFDKLKTIFNREFTKGRIFNENDKDLMNINSPNHLGLQIGKSSISKNKIKIVLNKGRFLRQGDAIRFVNSKQGMVVNYLYDKDGLLCNEAENICYVDNKLNIREDDIVSKTQDISLEKEYSLLKPRKIEVEFDVEAKINNNLVITISDGVHKLTENGNVVEQAKNSPTDKNTIINHLNKLGDTPFSCNKFNIEIDNDVFIQIKQINVIRRSLVNKLVEARKEVNIKFIEKKPVFILNNFKDFTNNSRISCLVNNEEQLKACLDLKVDNIYVNNLKLYDKYRDNKNIIFVVPRCELKISNLLEDKNLVSEYFKFDNTNSYGNYSLNVFNIYTAYYLNKFSLLNIPISVELNREEIEEFIKLFKNKFNGYLNFEVLSYGRVENMVIKGNILKLSDDKCRYMLRDKKLRKFPIYYYYGKTHILNYQRISITKINNCCVRLDFYDENFDEVREIVKSYQ